MRAEPMTGLASSVDPPGGVQVVIDSDMHAVRDGLQALFACSLLASLPDEVRGTAEIVLAEALNNVVEHAYASYPGKITVQLRPCDTGLRFGISDTGLPMPGSEPPKGDLREPSGFDDLPEGGFGWFLIRTLSHDLSYRREGGRNCLDFCISVDNPPLA